MPTTNGVLGQATSQLGTIVLGSARLTGKQGVSILTVGQQADVDIIHGGVSLSHVSVSDTADARNSVQHVAAVSAVSLAGPADGHDTVQRAVAADSISLLSDPGARNWTPHVDVVDAVALADAAELHAPVLTLLAQDSVTVSSQAEQHHRTLQLQAVNVLRVADETVLIGTIYVAATDTVQTSSLVFNADTGELDTVYAGLTDAPVTSVLHACNPVGRLSFGHVAQVGIIHSWALALGAADSVTLNQTAYRNKAPENVSAITLGDLALVTVGKPTSDLLPLGQQASVVVVRLLSAQSDLVIEQSFTYVSPSASKFEYSPLIGSATAGNPTPPAAILALPDSLSPGEFMLTYPAQGTSTDILVLRNPEFGNKDRLQFNRISRETRGGTLIVFADPMWPKIQTLVLTFSALKPAQAFGLQTFMENHLGQEIGLWDWEGRHWVGVITNPNDPVVEDSKDRFTAGLEFEGALASA